LRMAALSRSSKSMKDELSPKLRMLDDIPAKVSTVVSGATEEAVVLTWYDL
jgi:hypothetical protein